MGKEAAVKVAIEALEFYAMESRWDDFIENSQDAVFDKQTGCEFDGDMGLKARQAIIALLDADEKP